MLGSEESGGVRGAVFERAYHQPYLACGALLGGGGVNSGPPVIKKKERGGGCVCFPSE